MACCSRFSDKCRTKGLFSDGIAVRPTAAAARYRGCVAMQRRLAGTLTTYWRVCPPSGSSWRRRAGTFCSPQVRRRGLQSTRRTATSMPAPAAGAANGLSVLGRASRPQPRPPMHWKRPCAQIWSIWSPVSCRWQAGGSSTSMLPEHGQLMQYDSLAPNMCITFLTVSNIRTIVAP